MAPPSGDAPEAVGWGARFPVDGPPELGRFGPEPVADGNDVAWFASGSGAIGPGHLTGRAGDVEWDLSFDNAAGARPLYTFPRATWERELLPGSQIVPWPSTAFRGSFTTRGARHPVEGTGGVARIYGHGNAQRWGWLHADLGDGALLEIVTAVPRRPGLRLLPPLAMVQLRRPGHPDWPANPLLAALRFRTRLGLPRWSVTGRIGKVGLHVDVHLPSDRCVAVPYRDPDGAPATCTNSERADVRVVLERRRDTWVEDQSWELSGTAHAEIGSRP